MSSQEGVLWISNDWYDQMGAKMKPQKTSRPKVNPQKPQNKFGCNLVTKLRRHLHKSSDCFECPQKSLVKSSHPNKMHSDLFNTHTKGTEPTVRFKEVSIYIIEVGNV